MDSHDVVVVGGGDAGSVLAARLSERGGLKVLLIDTGSSERSAIRFSRGHHSGYRQWADWDFYDLLPYFKRSENAVGRDLILRGRGGPVTVASPAEPSPFLAAALEGAEEIGERRADDINSGFEEGFGPADFAADGYVVPAGRVVHNALVHRVRFARGRAVGVDYSVGSRLVSVAAGQVVVAGGAAESAQLLMLSGVGPAGHLRDRGIDVVADLPGVGANLQAHPVAKLVHGPDEPAIGEVIGLVRSQPELDGPDLRLTFGHGHTVHVSVILPHSRGSVRLADAMPGTPPLVEPNFYSDDRDLSAVVAGLRLARRIGRPFRLARRRAIAGPDQRRRTRASRVRPEDRHLVRESCGNARHGCCCGQCAAPARRRRSAGGRQRGHAVDSLGRRHRDRVRHRRAGGRAANRVSGTSQD
jgi:choline dehydrogenase